MKKNKTIKRILIIVAFIAINALILSGIGQIYVYLNTGADRTAIFHADVKKDGFYVPIINWSNLENPGRPMEIPTQNKIEIDYINAWYARNTALKTRNIRLLENAFTEKARKNVEALVAKNKLEKISIEGTTLNHTISLDFYSADGNLIVLTDRNVKSYQRVFKDEVFLFETEESSSYKIMMLLEDGFWRIRHMEKFEADSEPNIATKDFQFSAPIAGLNYYPQLTPWNTFGTGFSSETIENDFQIINELELNTIRVFVGYEDFGKASVFPKKIEKLTKLLDVADSHQLKVLITLFDFYGDYSVEDWTLTQKHALTIVEAVKDHPALLGWDVKNEADLDFESRGASLVKAWLSQMITIIRTSDKNHPITIGWSSAEASLNLEQEVDYVSFHYYQSIEGLSASISALREKTNKPIVLQEFGMSTYRGLWNPFGYSEEDQAAYYRHFYATQKRDSVNYLSWTLFDFPEIPNRVAGKYPWRKNKQTEFGLINIKGAKKAAFDILKSK